jgi:hypothetical protein
MPIKKITCWLFPAILLIFGQTALAQMSSLSGTVIDAADKPLEAATVSLLRAADSTLAKVELSDAAGRFEFTAVRPGDYRLAITLLGYERTLGEPFTVTTEPLSRPAIRLAETSAALEEVTVTALKPFLERRTDRLIVNVENSVLGTGSSALEVLERSPGVIVNQNDAIALRGRQGVIVMIDGKPTPLAGQELANYLRALPSSSIERIEIITNPSAKYDAAGNAGIIDIRLKKDRNVGTNGSVTANYGQGVYPKAGGGVTLNHRTKKVNVFGSYNYNYRKGLNDLRLYRTFYENGERTGAYDQRNFLTVPYNFHVARAGADFFLGAKTTLGVVATGSVNDFLRQGQNTSDVEGPTGEKVSSFTTTSSNDEVAPNYAANANLRHAFDAKGRELSADLDYAIYSNQADQRFVTRYFDLEGAEYLPAYVLVGDLGGELEIRSAKVDYTHPFAGAKLEAGVKGSIVDADNDVRFFDESQPGVPVYDSSISNHFIYRENINAAYLNFSREWTRFSIQTGLRAEQTVAEGRQLVNGQSFSRNYVNWFPSAFLNYKFSDKYEMGVNMSRRLDRPSYRQLNPFKYFLDPSTYSEGNPFLNPQFTWSFEWNHTFAQRYTASLSYAVTTDNITQVIGPVEGFDRVTVQTDRNLAEAEYISLNVGAPWNPFKWWNTINNIGVYRGRYRGEFANTNLRDGNWVFDFNTTNTFMLKNDWSAELNFTYHSPEIYAFMDLNPLWGLGFGVQKQLLQRRATLKIAFTDVFWTNLPSADIRYRDYEETFEVFRETRQATVSFTYRFGNNQVAQARRRTGGAEEEKRRAGGGQG